MLKDVRYHHVCFQDDMNMIFANQVCHKADILEFDVRDKDHAMTEEIGKVIFIIVVIIIVVIITIIIIGKVIIIIADILIIHYHHHQHYC